MNLSTSAYIENPFHRMKPKEKTRVVTAGVIRRAHKIGRGRFAKSTYSRTLSGVFISANPRVVRHLTAAIADQSRKIAKATRR